MHNPFLELLALTVIAGMWICERRASDPRLARGAYLAGIWGGLIGSRIWYSLQYGGFSISGGMASWGFLFGATLGSMAYLRWRQGRNDFGDFADAAAPALALGGVVMRFGCFLVGCNFGKVTDLAWGVQYGPGTPAFAKQVSSGMIDFDDPHTLAIHPTQLYESFSLLIALALILWASGRYEKHLRGGELFLSGIVYYCVFRFCIEYIRDDAGGVHFGPLTFAQGSCLLASTIVIVYSVYRRRQSRVSPRDWRQDTSRSGSTWGDSGLRSHGGRS